MRRNTASIGAYSLIELLAVLAIIGFLCSVAYPSYAIHLVRARRGEAIMALMEAMQREQAIYLRSNRYVVFSSETGADGGASADPNGFRWWSGTTAAASSHELRAQPCQGVSGAAGPAGLAECVEIVASPGTALVDSRFRDPGCGALTLVSTGERRAAGAASGCWP